MEDAKSEETKGATAKPDLRPDLDQSHIEKDFLIEKLLAAEQRNTLSVEDEDDFRDEADTVSSHATEFLIDDIDYIFEIAKNEALYAIENAKKKTQDCIKKAVKQNSIPDIGQNIQSESSSVRKRANVNTVHETNVPCQERITSISVKEMVKKIENRKSLSIAEKEETSRSESEKDEIVSDYKENAMESIIKGNLEHYWAYISDCVKATDLIAFFDLFTTAQTKEIRSLYKRSPNKATEKAFKEICLMHNQPDKYRRLLSALKDTGYSKVVQILKGTLSPVGRRHRLTIRNCTKDIFRRLNTLEVLPYLYSKGIISDEDYQQIQKTEKTETTGQAALELLDLLPNRSKRWYKYFVESLIQSGHEDLANILKENSKDGTAERQKRTKLGHRSDSLEKLGANNEEVMEVLRPSAASRDESSVRSSSLSEQSCKLVIQSSVFSDLGTDL